ncbi:cell division transport system permease protein [Caloramator quimbayensis]|uniref:Cell division protein FtsX n=1 Tax=Caloramator quimbayensis TaxID=1147123 RepID=A0A1T4XFA6_9CLOT|nr:permease-like cell division protein FtsX [Caloramator quimbayensis]SKA88067.1 cell division transport system permease protein [Caloramator quimbayensis]
MKIRTFNYFFKESFKSIKRNRVMSFASVTTVAAALFIFGVFMIIISNVNSLVDTVENKVEIKAFLKDDISSLKVRDIEKEIKAISGVKNVTYESKDEALKKVSEQLGENKDLTEGLEEDNPFPASFIIKVNKPSDVSYVSKELSKIQDFEKINDAQEIVNQIIKITNFIKLFSLILMIILSVIGISLISNTIKLTVYARKREISIMKYIGATDWFVKWPFLLEGIMLGLLGALIAIGFLSAGYSYGMKMVSPNILFFSFVPLKTIFQSILWQFLLVGMFIGGFGSLISIRKFLVL